MSETKTEFKAGDVVRYGTPGHPSTHCREGMAIAEARNDGVILFDTFWQTYGDRHLLTYGELQTAEVVFNLDDYDELDQYHPGSPGLWRRYNPVDREVVTSQHGLQRRWFIRKGAEPDLATQIENARQVLGDAQSAFVSAGRSVDRARDDLAKLEARS